MAQDNPIFLNPNASRRGSVPSVAPPELSLEARGLGQVAQSVAGLAEAVALRYTDVDIVLLQSTVSHPGAMKTLVALLAAYLGAQARLTGLDHQAEVILWTLGRGLALVVSRCVALPA